MNSLDLATFDELWEELKKRGSHVLLVIVKPEKVGEDEEIDVQFHGGKFQCVGLAKTAEHYLFNKYLEPGDDDLDDEPA